MEWVAAHNCMFSAEQGFDTLACQREALLGDPRPDAAATYWPTIARLAALGQVAAAAELLLVHPAYKLRGKAQVSEHPL